MDGGLALAEEFPTCWAQSGAGDQGEGQAVAVVQWSACAYHLKDREQWIGWNAMQCAQRRKFVVNNVRFLVRDHSPNLVSKALPRVQENGLRHVYYKATEVQKLLDMLDATPPPPL